MHKIGILSVGYYGFTPHVTDLSFREMTYEAATMAYSGILDPRKDVEFFISCQEDFWEGISISDEFAPDPLGGSMRSTMTVAGDGLQGIFHGFMMISSGLADIVVVESHGKPSEIENIPKLLELASDPIYGRGSMPSNVNFLGGLDASVMMSRGYDREDFARIASKNRRNGVGRPRSSYGSNLGVEDILDMEYEVFPLSKAEIAQYSDASVVVVVSSEEAARDLGVEPVWIDGIWTASAPEVDMTTPGKAGYMGEASRRAFQMARLRGPEEVEAVFLDDRLATRELIFLEEMGIQEPWRLLRAGDLEEGGYLPVNPYGGLLSKGVSLEASGLSLLLDAWDYLRANGGGRAVVGSWRGFPTSTGTVLVVSS